MAHVFSVYAPEEPVYGITDVRLDPTGFSYGYGDRRGYGSKRQPEILGASLLKKLQQYDAIALFEITGAMLFFFFIWGLMWMAIFDRTSIGAYIQARNISAAFSVLDLIIAFVFRDQLTSAVQDFIATPMKYIAIVLAVKNIANESASFFSTTVDKNCKICMSQTNRFFELIIALNYTALHLYLREPERVARPFGKQLDGTGDNFIEEKVKIFADDYRMPISQLELMIRELLRLISYFSRIGMVNPQEETVLYNQFRQLEEKLNIVQEGTMVSTPTLLYNQLLISVGVYILVIIPIQMYSLINTMTPLMLPVIMYLFLGAIVYKWWLGDPFDPDPRGDRFDYYKIRQDNEDVINNAWWYAQERKDATISTNIFSDIPCVHKKR